MEMLGLGLPILQRNYPLKEIYPYNLILQTQVPDHKIAAGTTEGWKSEESAIVETTWTMASFVLSAGGGTNAMLNPLLIYQVIQQIQSDRHKNITMGTSGMENL